MKHIYIKYETNIYEISNISNINNKTNILNMILIYSNISIKLAQYLTGCS